MDEEKRGEGRRKNSKRGPGDLGVRVKEEGGGRRGGEEGEWRRNNSKRGKEGEGEGGGEG